MFSPWSLAVGLFYALVALTPVTPAPSATRVAARVPMTFDDLPGWAEDDHAEALGAFRQSCALPPGAGPEDVRAGLARVCTKALALSAADAGDRKKAKAFFETNFQPFRASHGQPDGLLTGYFEPELRGRLLSDAHFNVPVLGRPGDLVDTVPANDRAAANAEGRLAAMRKTDAGLVPYYTRAEIEAGALAGRGLELLYLDSAIDAYFMHVQGSGSIRLDDGRVVRIGYAGKNGYPYTSAGSVLIRDGVINREDLTMQGMRAWLERHPKQAVRILHENKSYIFFEEKALAQGASGPIGGHGTPLTPRRSLAVDPAFHVLGAPVFVVSGGLAADGQASFRHLLIAEDVGSAIKGPERGDIFWGTGVAAGELAGRTKHRGNVYALLPREMGAP